MNLTLALALCLTSVSLTMVFAIIFTRALTVWRAMQHEKKVLEVQTELEESQTLAGLCSARLAYAFGAKALTQTNEEYIQEVQAVIVELNNAKAAKAFQTAPLPKHPVV